MGFTPEEYEQIGRHWHHMVGTAAALGHVSAASLHIYVDPEVLTDLGQLVLDSFTAASLDQESKEAQERISDFVNSTDTLQMIAEAVTRGDPAR